MLWLGLGENPLELVLNPFCEGWRAGFEESAGDAHLDQCLYLGILGTFNFGLETST